MKKLYSIRNGVGLFYTILAIDISIALVAGIFLIQHLWKEAIVVFVIALIVAGWLLILWHCNCLDYIVVTEKGIQAKQQFYAWDDVCVTAGYSSPWEPMGRRWFVYQLYFGTEYFTEKAQIKECKRKGLFLEINEKRLNIILQYYTKIISILDETPHQRKLLMLMQEHNNKVIEK